MPPRRVFRFVSRTGHYHSPWRRLPLPEDMPPRPSPIVAKRLGAGYGIEMQSVMRYVAQIPKRPRPGFVLCHNDVQHDAGTAPGWNGFRAWWNEVPPANFIECHCGWAPTAGPHYRLKPERKTKREKRTGA
jgi:hypothetical protein